ncbi:UDP-glucose--hexose-1-phosphate uridylyltransferase [Fusobacterium sp. MFO224]|uniref:UDP-glucose--hexose-1-phosphate uridylyltransferase n=1 Tax=Fusobacterium sp. MFO224 TaxID=3378070 RepID=UPI00385359F6
MNEKNVYLEIENLLDYACGVNFIEREDFIYFRNKIYDILKLEVPNINFVNSESSKGEPLYKILNKICNFAVEKNLIEDTVTERDLLDTKIMGELIPKPSEITNNFKKDYEVSPELATSNYYTFSQNTNYIRMDRIEKNLHWLSKTEYGDLEITINLSKPEKDPRDIAKAKLMKSSSYPKCLLCKENVGYSGNINHPARQNHRIIPITLENEPWFFQYSPYVYYNEHCIVLSNDHTPMEINKNTFEKLLDFIDIFPHYFIGSNADLPIVGGSILSHEHFQGGYHTFPMALASREESFTIKNYENIQVEKVKWPMSVIRLRGEDKKNLIELADKIFLNWKDYSDPKCGILAFSKEIPHNTITPIARKKENLYELDLVLRNNRTSQDYPLGIFHPHEELHHIKKENIGLIEVMGLAVLPGRLKEEISILCELLLEKNPINLIKENTKVCKHLEWCENLLKKYNNKLNKNNIQDILKDEIGLVFSKVLENAGVFKNDMDGKNGFETFIKSLN